MSRGEAKLEIFISVTNLRVPESQEASQELEKKLYAISVARCGTHKNEFHVLKSEYLLLQIYTFRNFNTPNFLP